MVTVGLAGNIKIEVSLSHCGFWEGCGIVPEMETESRLRVVKAKHVIEKYSTA